MAVRGPVGVTGMRSRLAVSSHVGRDMLHYLRWDAFNGNEVVQASKTLEMDNQGEWPVRFAGEALNPNHFFSVGLKICSRSYDFSSLEKRGYRVRSTLAIRIPLRFSSRDNSKERVGNEVHRTRK